MPQPPSPITSSSDSPDTLPQVGYNADQLAAYILRQLGGSIWTVEMTKQDILDNIQDALGIYGLYVPKIKPFAIQMSANQFAYLQGQDCGQGVVDVAFAQPIANAAIYANLITPINTTILFQTGLDSYDNFLRWRKTWQRVTSTEPDWQWDQASGTLYIHNPIERYHCAAVCYFSYDNTQQLAHQGAQWVKKYALETCRYQYGELLAKWSGAVPGPLKDLQLDNQKRSNAQARIDKYVDELKGMQTCSPLSVD